MVGVECVAVQFSVDTNSEILYSEISTTTMWEKPVTRSIYTSIYVKCTQISLDPYACRTKIEDVDRSLKEFEVDVYRVTLS
jgi:hypothetical protein